MRPRLAILNIVGIALLLAAWWAGLTQDIFSGANAPVCGLIVAALLLGLGCLAFGNVADARMLTKHITKLALIGTVVGFIILLKGAAGSPSGPEGAAQMMSAVFGGMSVALYATLLGLISNIWLHINLRIVAADHG